MINILIPLSGKNTFKINKQNSFPRILNEVNGKLLIEHAAEPYINIGLEKKITVAIPLKEADKYQLNKVVSLLGSNISTCSINGSTQGAACSALLAVESLDLDCPLIISSFEQVFDLDIEGFIQYFLDEKVDAGVLTFEAIHPKWSYVKTDAQGYVTQAAEKMPISKQAIAGFYFYKTARLFIEAAKSMIRKDVKTNDSFFIAPTLNEIILKEGIVKSIKIDKEKYHHISDEHTLELFDIQMSEKKEKSSKVFDRLTKEFFELYSRYDYDKMSTFFSNNIEFVESEKIIYGKHNSIQRMKEILDHNLKLNLKKINVTYDSSTIIEYGLEDNGKLSSGVFIIYWNEDKNISKIKSYSNGY